MSAAWAVAVDRLADLAEAVAEGALRPASGGWRLRPGGGPEVLATRLYVGEEFCEHLVPTLPELEAVIEAARAQGAAVTLATPPLTDAGLAAVRPLLARLAAEPGAEVVANDWGLLRLVAREHPGLARVLGRTLRRQLKDPREAAGPAAAAMPASYRDLLARLGVAMIGLDRVPDGPAPHPVAMHVPFEFVSSGRICAVSGLHFPDVRKFLADFACPRPCRDFVLDLEDPGCRAALVQKGNTLHAPNGGAAAVAAAPPGLVARWVWDASLDRARALQAPPACEAESEAESGAESEAAAGATPAADQAARTAEEAALEAAS